MRQPRGVIALFTVLVLGVSSLTAAAILARGSFEGYLDAVESQTAWSARAQLFGCVDEALIQLQKNNDYAPTTIFTGSSTCALTVATPATEQRSLHVTLTEGVVTRSATVTVSLNPFAVTQVTEP